MTTPPHRPRGSLVRTDDTTQVARAGEARFSDQGVVHEALGSVETVTLDEGLVGAAQRAIEDGRIANDDAPTRPVRIGRPPTATVDPEP